jgi:hypothetical protein
LDSGAAELVPTENLKSPVSGPTSPLWTLSSEHFRGVIRPSDKRPLYDKAIRELVGNFLANRSARDGTRKAGVPGDGPPPPRLQFGGSPRLIGIHLPV